MPRFLFLFLSCSLFLCACKKETFDTEAPAIAFLSPENHGDTASGDSLKIKVELKDNVLLDRYELKIIEIIANKRFDTVEAKQDFVKARFAELKFNFVYTVQEVKYYEIQMKVYDKAGNTSMKSVYQHIVL